MEKLRHNAALLLVDIQNDFCPGGALGVSGGDEIVEIVNRLTPRFGVVVASQDWHPPSHISFKERGGPWPPHCVQGTPGAELHPGLDTSRIDFFLRKATSPDRDAYSAFEASDDAGRTLDDVLKSRGVTRIYVAGLATDYCVRATALDAVKSGYQVSVIEDAVRAVEANPGDGAKALEEIVNSGGRLVNSNEIV